MDNLQNKSKIPLSDDSSNTNILREIEAESQRSSASGPITNELIHAMRNIGITVEFDQNGIPQIYDSKIVDPSKLITNPEFLRRLKGGVFISDPFESKWFFINFDSGRMRDIIPITSFIIFNITVFNHKQGEFKFLLIEFSTDTANGEKHLAVISFNNFSPKRILTNIKGLTYLSPKGEALAGPLVYSLISKYLKSNKPIYATIGPGQGWRKDHTGKFSFYPKLQYIDLIEDFLPKSIKHREAVQSTIEPTKALPVSLLSLFSGADALLVLLLWRISSMLLTFFAMNGVYPDNILVVHPTENVDFLLISSILNNVHYTNFNKVPSLGPKITELNNYLCWTNDGVVVIIDSLCADQRKKCEAGYNLLLNDVSGVTNDGDEVHHVIALVSRYADLYFPHDKFCLLEFNDDSTKYTPIQFRNACRQLDNYLTYVIEDEGTKFSNIFRHHYVDVINAVPEDIPLSKKSSYIILTTTLRTCNDIFDKQLFHVDFEKEIEKWICYQQHEMHTLDDIVCSEYSKILNQKIADNYFKIVLKPSPKEVTPFNIGKHMLIVDRVNSRIYIEPDENFLIIKNGMNSVHDSDSLTTALFNEGYLHVNEHNSKCHRLHTINAEGSIHTLYSHAISFDLITPENRQRFELIDKEAFLFKYDEIPEGFLPLIKTADGRYAGKMLRYSAEESNIYFGTGRTGSGKSWAIAQIIVMLFMLGHLVVVFDVSGSYTKEKLLKMLPTEVVEKLFKFINVGAGKDMIPVDLGSLRGCETLPDKKRAIYSVLRAAAGSLDKSTSRKLKGFLSEYLKNKEYTIDLNDLCSKLEEVPGFGAEVADCVQSVLDDIGEIGYEEQTWDDLFLQGRKIIVIDLGNEVGDSNHQLLDMMVGSLFSWQMSHDNGFLSIAIDELIDQDFSTGSPLQTIVKQGRKFHNALIGATQDYFNQGSSNLDVLKQANIKSYCRPGKSADRVAQMLGYSNAAAAGVNSFNPGDQILEFYGYNRDTGENEAIVIKGRVVDFIDTPLYKKFLEEYSKPHYPPGYYGNVL